MKDATPNEVRVQRLLDQLDNPGLRPRDIELLERKIALLKSQG